MEACDPRPPEIPTREYKSLLTLKEEYTTRGMLRTEPWSQNSPARVEVCGEVPVEAHRRNLQQETAACFDADSPALHRQTTRVHCTLLEFEID